ncbi:MAG: hypothetical protein KY442_06470 [Proteobacteria bacterium]|nr:hypothetical protein [Pseudomonadota bacterium]
METRLSRAAATWLALACTAAAITAAGAIELTTNASNPDAIGVPEQGTGSLYPSPITVNDLRGNITSVTVTLNSLTHNYPDDLEVMLLAPGGQQIRLMSDVGAGVRIDPVTLTLSDASHANVAPRSEITSGTYRPTDWIEDNYDFPGVAPADTPNQKLGSLNGDADAQNGVWKLYVADKGPGDGGVLAGGWTLSINQDLFVSCAQEGFSGRQLTLCQRICEVDQPPARLSALIRTYMRAYRNPPPCD